MGPVGKACRKIVVCRHPWLGWSLRLLLLLTLLPLVLCVVADVGDEIMIRRGVEGSFGSHARNWTVRPDR